MMLDIVQYDVTESILLLMGGIGHNWGLIEHFLYALIAESMMSLGFIDISSTSNLNDCNTLRPQSAN